jgi:hypothetical protein
MRPFFNYLVRSLFLGPALCICSCTIVNVTNGDVTERSIFPGFTLLEISSRPMNKDAVKAVASPLYVEVNGLGIVADQQSLTIGWSSKEVLQLPDPSLCQAVFFIEDREQLLGADKLLESVTQSNGICEIARQKDL